MSDLSKVQEVIAEHLDDIKTLFKPGAKITLLVRAANNPEGRKDFMMGDDEPQEAMNMIARCMAGASVTAGKSE